MQTRLLLPDSLVLDHGLARGFGVVVTDGKVLDVVPASTWQGDTVLLRGTLLPGAIDLQVNGMGGRSVDEGSADALDAIATAAMRGGAAAFLPTLITAPFDALLQQLAAVAAWAGERAAAPIPDQAVPLGLHLEGPFLEEAGAHDGGLFLDPSAERIEALCEAAGDQLALVTLAPDRPGAAAAIAHLRRRGVAVALGHGRGYSQFASCVAAGATAVTHLFNAMGPLHHRQPGLAGHALDTEALLAPLIVDGHHVHPAMVRTAWRVLGPRRFALVTDAMPAAGLGDGDYSFGCIRATVTDAVARDADGNLAGSVLTMGEAISNLMEFVPQVGPWSAAQAAAANPARLLGQTTWGAIRPGAVARFTLMDPASGPAATRAICGATVE